MADNVTELRRPRVVRPVPEPLGLHVRAARNDHTQLLNLLAAGDLRCFGLVIDSVSALDRHRELREQALANRLDVALDPQTQPAATIGGHTEAIGRLPWGEERPHRVSDFAGRTGRDRIARLGDFAVENGFTQVLAPTHLLQGTEDPWFPRDLETVEWLRAYLDSAGGSEVGLIYPLAIPYSLLRNRGQRRALIAAMHAVPASAIWLQVEGFGSSSTAAAACNYMDAAPDFHELGLPLVGDHVGGLIGLSLLAFGAVGGIAHGVTMGERFSASNWNRAPEPGRGFAMPKRVYVRELDLMLKPAEARLLFDSATRASSLFGCRDRHCCPRGVQDMLENPSRHFLYKRSEDVASLGRVPESMRPQTYLENYLRPTTDRALAAANINWSDEAMAKKAREQRRRLDALRVALSHQVEASPPRSFASVPLRRARREALG